MSEGEGDSFAALQTRIAAYPKSTRGVYYAKPKPQLPYLYSLWDDDGT